jgi:hypothetical protein
MKKGFILFSSFLLLLSLKAQNGGTALNLAGAGYVNCTPVNSYWTTATSNITIEFWFMWNGTSTTGQMITNGNTGLDGVRIQFNSDATISIGNSGAGGTSFNNFTVMADKWYHLAAVLTSNPGEWKLYINGEKQTATSSNFSIIAPNGTNNGRSVIGAGHNGAEIFNGIIDEVRIWNSARTEDELGFYRFRELTGTESDLIAYYKLNDGIGFTATDSDTSGSFNGTLQGSAAWVTSGALGVSNYSLTEKVIGSPTGAFPVPLSIACWVKINSYKERSIFNVMSSLGTDIFKLLWLEIGGEENKNILFGYDEKYVGSGGFNEVKSTSLIPLDEWVHLAGTFDGDSLRIYINGIKDVVNSGSIGNPAVFSLGNWPLIIAGTWNDSISSFDGYIDDLSVWVKALSENEIKDIMYQNLTGYESDLYDYFRFDEAGDKSYSAVQYAFQIASPTTGKLSQDVPYNTWIGGLSSNWNDPENWSTGTVPLSNQNVVLNNYTLSNAPIITGSPTVNNLIIKDGVSPTLSSDITINGTLTLGDNNLYLNGNNITFGPNANFIENDNAKITGSSGSITTTRTLNSPNGLNVLQLGAEITSSANLGNTTISRIWGEKTGNGNSSILRSYNIIPQNNTGLNATLVFHYDDSELNGLNESDLVLFKSTDGGNTWTNEGGTVNTTENTVELSGIDGFSLWTLAENSNPLPVELTYFEGTATEDDVLLEWQTATEVNNYGFDVERRSSSLIEWDKIGFVQGHGTTNSPKNYEFTDSELPNSESVDYRLKQIDNDGKFTYSKVITVDLSTITNIKDEVVYEFALEQNYPNPFNPTTTINFTVPTPPHPSPYKGEGTREGLVLLRVYDILGREVATLVNQKLKPGNYEVQFNASSLSSGMYFYRIDIGNRLTSVKKMILIK